MASLTWCTWVWVNSRSWWWTGRPGLLLFMGSQRVRHGWATELNWNNIFKLLDEYQFAAAAVKSLQSCPTLWDPIDGSPLGSSVPGILQAKILEWVAISFSNAWKWKVKVKHSVVPTLSDPMDCSLPGFSVHGIFEWKKIKLSVFSYLEMFHLEG